MAVRGPAASHSDAYPPPIAGHGEISVSIERTVGARILFITNAVTIPDRCKTPDKSVEYGIQTILLKFECLAFDINLRRTCIKIGQKLRFIANDSFNPVC
jgi:hypothetical protein